MIFYSRENGRDGEKDYLDTNDFRDVYFEKVSFSYLLNGKQHNSKIELSLIYREETNEVLLKGEMNFNDSLISSEQAIDPVALVEQGAEAYYQEKLLDSVEVVVVARNKIESEIKDVVLNNGGLLKGTNLDILGFIKVNNNVIATMDDIIIEDESHIKARRSYSIIDLNTLNDSTVEILLSETRKLIANVELIDINDKDNTIEVHCSNQEVVENNFEGTYKKSNDFDSIEEYAEDRAKYINVETEPEEEFDDFEDLF